VSAVLRPRKSSDTWTACFGEHSAPPTVRTCVVFVCDEGDEAARAAATARSLGFTRCAVLQGGLTAYDATVPLQPATQYINRWAPPASRGGKRSRRRTVR
jgi:rhodanese-related sulfurtransferase